MVNFLISISFEVFIFLTSLIYEEALKKIGMSIITMSFPASSVWQILFQLQSYHFLFDKFT